MLPPPTMPASLMVSTLLVSIPAPVEKIVSLAVRVNGEPVEVVQSDPAPDEWGTLLKAYKALNGR